MEDKIINSIENSTSNNWNIKDTVFAIITVIASVFFVSTSLFGEFNLGFTISFVLLFVLVNVYISKQNRKYTPFSLFCGISSVLLSGVFTIYSHSFMSFLLFIACFALLWIFTTVSFVNGDHIIRNSLRSGFVTPFRYLPEPFRSYNKYCKENNKGPNVQILIGLAISIPILAIVLPLLINSDAAFEGLINTIFSDFAEVVIKIILGTTLAAYLFSKLFAINKKLDNYAVKDSYSKKGFSHITAVTVLSVLSVFYAIYMFSQLAYFFSAFSGILPKDYTFSVADYARRGFFELCGVCTVNFVVLALITAFSRRNENNKNYFSLKLTSSIICGFSFIFISTAISKMVLYIQKFGLTCLRLETSVFMLMLFLMFIGTLIYIFKNHFPLTKYIIVSTTIIVMLMSFANVDRTVAQYNVYAYQNGILSEVDVEYLGSLSDSALPYIEKLLDDENASVKEEAKRQLYFSALNYYDVAEEDYLCESDIDWKYYNYSSEKAKKIILEHKSDVLYAGEHLWD